MTKRDTVKPAAAPAVIPAPIKYIDNPHAPEVFAECAPGFSLLGGVVHITFISSRIDHNTIPGTENKVVIGRLAMPFAGARDLANGLVDFLRDMEASQNKARDMAADTKPRDGEVTH
jgi:hypothetical protein